MDSARKSDIGKPLDINEDGGGARMGRVRWTICAMLFFATSINYMDRQVIALLKPTLIASGMMNEISYGQVVVAFQVAYALGLLIAGRVVEHDLACLRTRGTIHQTCLICLGARSTYQA